ncbi:hypothetical protein Zmor_028086 [Zophobas morio]|uniref:Ionotropic glutamate receptor C-terminal domain-containing protein n=1 Tax=Zophobas morio TaxID=2755281 RepID=A0AA38HQ73_9CUCU|nr:hypothetical protein Zmor_028086 [Zophobas morio]
MNLTILFLTMAALGSEKRETLLEQFNPQCLVKVIDRFAQSGTIVLLNAKSTLWNWNWKKICLEQKFVFLTSKSFKFTNHDLLTFAKEVYIFEFRTLKELQAAVNELRNLKFWNARSKFLLLYLEDGADFAIERFFKLLWSSYIYDVVVVTVSKLYIWHPYLSSLTVRNICSKTTFNKTLTISEVPRVLVPHPLKVEVVVFPPYVITNDAGGDIAIVKELAQIMKTDLFVNHSETPFDFGVVLENGTVSGMFGAAYYHKSDMSIGGFILDPDRYTLLDASYTYHNEFYYWCVPRARKLPSWKQVFETMTLDTWLLIFVAYITIATLAWCSSSVKKEENVYKLMSNCLFYNLEIFLGASASIWPKSQIVRCLMSFWVVICLILKIIYSTKFISLMERRLEETQISTMDELLQSDLEIWMKPSTVSLFGESPTLQNFIQKGYNKCSTALECTNRVVRFRNASVLVSESFIKYTQNLFLGRNNLPRVYCFDSGVNISPIFIGMRKGFPLKSYVDAILKRFVEAGLVQFWRKQTFQKHQKGNHVFRKRVNLEFAKAPLFCWLVGIAASVGVFVIEMALNSKFFIVKKNDV